MRQEFTANVSHELKTPLTSISGYAEMIATGIAKEEDVQNFARRIHSESSRLLSLIADIIQLSELDYIEDVMILKMLTCLTWHMRPKTALLPERKNTEL